jgi:phosphoesterase RecJ-like protein
MTPLHAAPAHGEDALRVLKRIESARRPVIVSHVRLDGDALGSELGLWHLLRGRGVAAEMVNDSAIPQIYRWLPGVESVGLSPAALRGEYDLAVLLDTPSWTRAKAVRNALPKDQPTASIDHHLRVDRTGDAEWIDTSRSSVGEMVYALARAGAWSISPEAATSLYVALMTDTGRFTFPNTTAETLRVAADLVQLGAEHVRAADRVYQETSFGVLKLRAEALANLTLHAGGRIAVMRITDEMLRRNEVDPIDTQEMADYPRSAAGVQIGVLLREMKDEGKIKVSLRARKGVNIEPAARALGGGGHKEAAGAEPPGHMAGVEARTLELLRGMLPA